MYILYTNLQGLIHIYPIQQASGQHSRVPHGTADTFHHADTQIDFSITVLENTTLAQHRIHTHTHTYIHKKQMHTYIHTHIIQKQHKRKRIRPSHDSSRP